MTVTFGRTAPPLTPKFGASINFKPYADSKDDFVIKVRNHKVSKELALDVSQDEDGKFAIQVNKPEDVTAMYKATIIIKAHELLKYADLILHLLKEKVTRSNEDKMKDIEFRGKKYSSVFIDLTDKNNGAISQEKMMVL